MDRACYRNNVLWVTILDKKRNYCIAFVAKVPTPSEGDLRGITENRSKIPLNCYVCNSGRWLHNSNKSACSHCLSRKLIKFSTKSNSILFTIFSKSRNVFIHLWPKNFSVNCLMIKRIYLLLFRLHGYFTLFIHSRDLTSFTPKRRIVTIPRVSSHNSSKHG